MMIGSDMTAYGRAAFTAEELQLPVPDPAYPLAQKLNIKAGDEFRIFNEKSDKFGHYIYGRHHDGVMGSRPFIEFRQVGGGGSLLLYQDQILKLEKANRVVAITGRRRDMFGMPGAVHQLTSEEVAESIRRITYVDAMLAEMRVRKTSSLTDAVKMEVAARVAASRSEECPSRGWLYKILRIERDVVALNRFVKFAPIRLKGNRKLRFLEVLYEIRDQAVVDALVAKTGAESARIRVKKLVEDGAEFAWARDLALDEHGEPVMKLASFTKTIQKTDAFTKLSYYYGEEHARREYSRSVSPTERPTTILDIVDVDHTTLPINVYDPLFPTVAYGRPDIVSFRDRFSGVTFGYAISFSAPSFETFLAGFRHAVFPKDDMAVDWPWFGKPMRLGVDWASHFVGDSMMYAERMLEFELTTYRKRVPEDKSALEHTFYVLDINLLSGLPGHMPRPKERGKRDHEELKIEAELSIVELRALLDDYFANEVNRKPTLGLGDLPTVKAIPAQIWSEALLNAPERGLVDPQAFVWLAGDQRNVTIQSEGIRVEELIYQSHHLLNVEIHPDHNRGVRDKAGTRNHRGTRYVVTRDLEDVGYVWLIDHHHDNHPIKVPVAPEFASYANGLTAYQHDQVLQYRKKQLEERGMEPSFREAFERLRNQKMDFQVKVKRDQWSTKVARHLERSGQKIARRRVVDMTWVDSGARTSLAEPSTIKPQEPISHRASRKPKPRVDKADHAPMVIVAPKPTDNTSTKPTTIRPPRLERSIDELRQIRDAKKGSDQ